LKAYKKKCSFVFFPGYFENYWDFFLFLTPKSKIKIKIKFEFRILKTKEFLLHQKQMIKKHIIVKSILLLYTYYTYIHYHILFKRRRICIPHVSLLHLSPSLLHTRNISNLCTGFLLQLNYS